MSRILRPHRYHRLLVHLSCVAIVMFLILAIHDYRMSSDESVRYFRRNISTEFPKYGQDSFGGRQRRRTNGNNTSRIQENDFLDHANGSYREHLNLMQSLPDLRKDDYENGTVCPTKRRNVEKENRSKVGLPAIKHRPYGDFIYKAPSSCPPPMRYYNGLPKTALVSYPGSDSTWLRHLLQVATGWWWFQISYCNCIQNIFHHEFILLTHWGRVTYICVSRLTTIGSDNSLSPSRRYAII